MMIDFGAEVVDKNGKVLGAVARVIQDAWTGEPRKFQVTSQNDDIGLFIPASDVAEATPRQVKLKVAFD